MILTLTILGLVIWFGCGLVAQAAFKTNMTYNHVDITWKYRLSAFALLLFGCLSLLIALCVFLKLQKINGERPWEWTDLHYFFPKNPRHIK